MLQQKYRQIEQLQQQLAVINPKVKNVFQIEQQKKQLNQFQQLINRLNQQKFKTMNLMTALSQSIPNGMKVMAIKLKDNQLSITGYSYQHEQILWLLHALENRQFKQPVLQQIKAISGIQNYSYEFQLEFLI